MCKFGTGRQGPQGPQGPAGTPTVEILLFTQGTTNIAALTTFTVFASASVTGEVVYNGLMNVQADAAIKATVIPVINGVQQTARQTIITLPAPVGGTAEVVIPLSGLITILSGQSFAFDVTLSNYASAGKALFTSVNYNIQS